MYIIAGLGNPTKEYEGTRHNVGFDVIDRLSERYNIDVTMEKHRALIGKGMIAGQKVILVKPQTYMNLSGNSVVKAASFYKIPPQNIVVIHDDMDLLPGQVKAKKGGGAGGHNGLKNIIQHLGTDQFPRVKVGVGNKPRPDSDMAAWVLGKFTGPDREAMEAAVKKAADAVTCLIEQGADKAMAQFNG